MLGEGAPGSLLQSFITYLLRLFIGFLVLVIGGNIFVDPFTCIFFIIKMTGITLINNVCMYCILLVALLKFPPHQTKISMWKFCGLH